MSDSVLGYDAPLPTKAKSDADDPIAKKVIDIINSSDKVYDPEYTVRDKLRIIKESIFDTQDPSNLIRRVLATTPFISFLKMFQQMQLPDMHLECAGVPENVRMTTQSMFEDALEMANWARVLTGTNGAQAHMIGYGDAFVSLNPSELYLEKGKGFPWTYRLEPTQRIKFQQNTAYLRNPGDERECRQIVFTREYDLAQAYADNPELEKNGAYGYLPTSKRDQMMSSLTEEQFESKEKSIIEIAQLVDLNKPLSAKVAGKDQFLFDEMENDDFPFLDTLGEPDFSLGQLVAYEKEQGMLNYGVLHAVYRLSIVLRIMDNQKYNWTISNSDPVRIVGIDGLSSDEFEARHDNAVLDRAAGKTPVIYTKDAEKISVNNLGTAEQGLINMANDAIANAEKQIKRLGIPLDSTTIDPNQKLGQTELEFESQTMAARTIQRQNADTYRILAMKLQQEITDNIKDDNDIKLRSTNKIRNRTGKLVPVPGVTVRNEFGQPEKIALTLGDLHKEFVTNFYKIRITGGVVNPRSYTRTVQDNMRNNLTMLAQMGDQRATKALADLAQSQMEADGIGFNLSDIPEGPQQPQAAQGGAPQAAPRPATPSVPTAPTL